MCLSDCRHGFACSDVKPSNMLLDDGGDQSHKDCLSMRMFGRSLAFFRLGHCHLTDFSVAFVVQSKRLPKSIAGTRPYMGEITTVV